MTTSTQLHAREKPVIRPTKSQARFAFTILLIINILNYADRYVLPAILSKIHLAPKFGGLGLTTGQLGLIGSSFLLVYALASIPLGTWADRSSWESTAALCV